MVDMVKVNNVSVGFVCNIVKKTGLVEIHFQHMQRRLIVIGDQNRVAHVQTRRVLS